jgi:hypothetical protein
LPREIEERKSLKKLKDFMVEEKMYGKQLKMLLRKASYIHTEIVKIKNGLLEYQGYFE